MSRWRYFVQLDGDFAKEYPNAVEAETARASATGKVPPESRRVWRERPLIEELHPRPEKPPRRKHCPHIRVRGIYGDEILASGNRRNHCLDCGRLLDGPVLVSVIRANEATVIAAALAARQDGVHDA
jgi:hypothetical protein